MCQIQIIQRLGKEKIDKLDVGEFFKMMCFGSMDNKDAFGVFNEEYLFKRKGAFDASRLDEYDLIKGNFIVGHNRFSTSRYMIEDLDDKEQKFEKPKLKLSESKKTSRNYSGRWNWSVNFLDNIMDIFLPTCGWNMPNLDIKECKVEEREKTSKKKEVVVYKKYSENRNHHPFEIGDFTLIHNGTILNAQELHKEYNFQTTINTDSYIILELIDHFFKESRIKDRIKRIAIAIQKTCLKLKGGYSVLLYDKKGKNTFYFKNFLTSFSLCKYGDRILCGSTSNENLRYLYFGMKREKIKIKNKRIYLITSNMASPVTDITPPSLRDRTSWKTIIDKSDWRKVDEFLEKTLGFIPLYVVTSKGDLKISRNNANGIRENIHKITRNPKIHWGWYLIKSSEIKPFICKHKMKLDKLKGGKK